MPDVYAAVTELDHTMQERLADVLETRGADPRQQTLRQAFLADIPFPSRARVLEIGCGTGVLTRVLARWPKVDSVVAVDPAPSFLRRARELATGLTNIDFQEGDGRRLSCTAESFDVVIFDSTLSHVPTPEHALAEAFRVLRPAGWLASFDGDYATTTVALADHDPLQACAATTMAHSVTDRLLMRRLPALVRDLGFEDIRVRSHGFAEQGGGYMQTVVDRGADILQATGQIGDDLAAALKAEARRRVNDGTFFGHIAYVSVIARKS